MLMDFVGDYFTKDGETYMNIKSLKIMMTPTRGSFHFDDIFAGDPALTNLMNSYVNSNWELFVKTMNPEYVDKLGERFRVIFNNVCQKTPIRMIFPE